MFLKTFKLAEDPFGVTPDPRFIYLSQQHREAMASLAYGTQSNRGFLALIAKPGMGKTTLLYHYLSWLRDNARTAYIFRTDCDSRELIRHILLDLGVESSTNDLPAMHDSLNKILMEESNRGRRFVLVIDEAQNLDEQALESVRLLSNFETPWKKLMQIVIAGQPGLAEKLARPSMTQLRQRISMVMRLEPFNREDTSAYIDRRLWVAGREDSQLFTAGAKALIAEYSKGIPRNINNICFNAMSLACASKRTAIDREVVREVLADLEIEALSYKQADSNTEVISSASAGDIRQVKPRLSGLRSWIPKMLIGTVAALVLMSIPGHLERAVPFTTPSERALSARSSSAQIQGRAAINGAPVEHPTTALTGFSGEPAGVIETDRTTLSAEGDAPNTLQKHFGGIRQSPTVIALPNLFPESGLEFVDPRAGLQSVEENK
jgi:general secretion pathway protein A